MKWFGGQQSSAPSSSMFDKFLHLSKSGSFAIELLEASRSLREAVGNLLIVTMYFQNSSSRFHRPGLRAVDLRVHVASASTRTLAFHKSHSCWAVRAQNNHSRWAFAQSCSIGFSLRFRRKLHQPVPSARIYTRTQTDHVLSSWKTHGRDTTCFSTEPLAQTAIPEQLQGSLTSPAQSASVITTTEPCGMPGRQGTSRFLTNDHVARRSSNQISQQTLNLDFITSGSYFDVGGQLTKLRSWCQDDPTRVTYQATVSDVVVQIRPGYCHCRQVSRNSSVLDPLRSPNPKSLHNFVTLSHETPNVQPCGVRHKERPKELLRLVSHHTPTHCHVFPRVPATNSLSINWDQPPACRPHAFQCKCPVQCSQTDTDRAHLEHSHVLSTCQTKCSGHRLGDVLKTQHGLSHSPNHTSAIRQNLRVPAFRWLCVQLFAFTDFSGEKSLCVLSATKASCPWSRLSRHLAKSIRMPCIVAVATKQPASLWGSSQPEFSSCLPSGRTWRVFQQATRPRTPLRNFHALQDIELFLTSSFLGRHCHVLVSLEETFRRRLRAVTHFMSLLKS